MIIKIARKNSRNPRRLVTIPTSSDGRWHGKWTCDYLFTLQELQLQDLAEDEAQRDAQVSVTLSIQKHAGFGLSVDGKVTTSFTRKCCCCSSPFCREINANFNVWVLPSGRHNGTTQLPEIGGDDQVIYVKPGYEADLDSLVQDTVRLATSVKETCSDSCEKSQPRMQYLGEQKAASIDGRWSRLLELRNAC
ncbi:large ribosomal RNA subunit accumulation protein YCED homolog 2, chloroplastic isoform X2 [Diospyros lotus]|uniref:large ribosomal RNA subunit accumulation protein YCED homolog 2, chloroplastic isoform X2 n=1 Tax=Diospyros lotus TaxID=55363 RepID=UPI0022562ED1|nr:large ribosomal RNA subunit accumulation protein YCED homolog 2, chloroplastic isoform X2 [Diospyros lotus]XP_052204542.1 large ribosomal RNA subunit accumulation protein YCED homolog 2, chloroplastic isoform X2 [Diospyros lotus]